MILPVYVYGTSVLKKKAKEIPEDFEDLNEFINNMFETMYHSDGVGLAAPQVGKSLRLFVIDASATEEEDDEFVADFKKVFINPEIISEEGKEWAFNEGCLSVPLIREDVMRKSTVTIQYYDENWEFHEEKYDGIKARIIQHEYDHLEGTLFIDRLNPLRKKLLNGRLKAISKGKVDVDYKIRIPAK